MMVLTMHMQQMRANSAAGINMQLITTVANSLVTGSRIINTRNSCQTVFLYFTLKHLAISAHRNSQEGVLTLPRKGTNE